MSVRIVAIMAVACQGRTDPPQLASRTLANEPLTADVPSDARIEDRSWMGPDDGGAQRTCVTLHGDACIAIEPAYRICGDDCAPNKCWRGCETTVNDTLPKGAQVLRNDHTANGWIVAYTAEQMFHLVVHKTIAGKAWECSATTKTRAELDEAERVCTSIR